MQLARTQHTDPVVFFGQIREMEVDGEGAGDIVSPVKRPAAYEFDDVTRGACAGSRSDHRTP